MLKNMTALTEQTIRPDGLFEEYLDLAKKDAETLFLNTQKLDISCPACALYIKEEKFSKDSFSYKECPDCFTVFCSPRPQADAFAAFYKDAPSTRFWAEKFYKETESARREHLWKPKAALILQKLNELAPHADNIIDIGGGYGLFAEEMQKITDKKITVIEPSDSLSRLCREKGFQVIDKFLETIVREDMPSGQSVFTSFELFEHLHDPELFFQTLQDIMRPDDIFIFTTLSSFGLDILLLKENSKAISPPHHLNFLNPPSIKIFLERLSFLPLEITTPGKLDVDIVDKNMNHVHENSWKILMKYGSEHFKCELQTFLRNHNFSSHMMVVCKKGE
jgi:SAM-dependent methyltransferase